MAESNRTVPRLIVTSPPGRDALLLTRPEMIVGHSGTADLALDDQYVSRRHALITVECRAGDDPRPQVHRRNVRQW